MRSKRSRRIWFAALAVAAAPAVLTGYVRLLRDAATPYFQGNPSDLMFWIQQDTAAGQRNGNNGIIITPDSSPNEAILSAIQTWDSIDDSSLRFRPALPHPTADASSVDGANVITFADTPVNRSVSNGAIAVTRLVSISGGELIDTDIIFNPTLAFSTTLQSNTFDIEGTTVHELGHALGMDHAGVATATLFATTSRGSSRNRTLTDDDKAFAKAIYPRLGSTFNFGTVEGSITDSSNRGVNGALVALLEPTKNLVFETASESTGSYRIGALPPGDYILYAEPADGPTEARYFSAARQNARTNFHTTFFGPFANPVKIPVRGGEVHLADLIVEDPKSTLNLRGFGAGPAGVSLRTRIGAELGPGAVYRAELHGEGLDDDAIQESSIRFLGSGVSVVPGSFLKMTPIVFTSGDEYPRVRVDIQIAAGAPLGLVDAVVVIGDRRSVFTGAIEIRPDTPEPIYPFNGVVNGASFQGGPIAPGEIVSIFGQHLGPDPGVGGFINPITGKLASLLEGTAVFFNGVPAPLFYAGSGQLNAQVPTDLLSGSTVLLSVSRNGVSGDPLFLSSGAQSPALFVVPGKTDAAALDANWQLVSNDNPVSAGEYVILFGTGQGAIAPTLATGARASGVDISHVSGVTEAYVGGVPALVGFAGMSPGFVGLTQFNVQVPQGVAPGAASVQIVVRGTSSPPGPTIEVR